MHIQKISSAKSAIQGRNVGPVTQESATAAARALAAKGNPASVGRLHVSPRRWLWAVRATACGTVETFDDGATFEPVEVFRTA
jgi:hypothetical protein